MKHRIILAFSLFLSGHISFSQDGSIDESFKTGPGANNYLRSIAIQTDGKILIGGFFTRFNETPINSIARLNNDGSLDKSFNVGNGTDGYINTISIQSDNKIVIGGGFSKYNDNSIYNIVRLNSDGSIDNTFKVGVGTHNLGYVRTSAIQPDGKILIGGNFTSYNGTNQNYITRLNSDGTIDNTFSVGTGTNFSVRTISLQKDGKILIGGGFSKFNGNNSSQIARLNIDGSYDPSFSIGSGADAIVVASSIQNDDKILIGGNFTTFNNLSQNRIARLNTNGSLDPTFLVGTGANDYVYTFAIQNDNKIIIGGYFTEYNGIPANFIARLNIDGTLDQSFDTGVGADDYVYDCAIQSDGKIILGGDFTNLSGNAYSYIVRLNSTPTGIEDDNEIQNEMRFFPNPNNGIFSVFVRKEGDFNLQNISGLTIRTVKLNEGLNSIDLSMLENGIYFLKSNSNLNSNYKIIISK
jgi:uncharacterized delta-60 repeat protein